MDKSKLFQHVGIPYVNFVKENIEKDGIESSCQSKSSKSNSKFKLTQ